METDRAGLSHKQAIALALIVSRGLTYREVAATLDVPAGTVLSLVRSALTQLRSQTLSA